MRGTAALKFDAIRMKRWLDGSKHARGSPTLAPQNEESDVLSTRIPVDFTHTERLAFTTETKWLRPTAPQVSGGTKFAPMSPSRGPTKFVPIVGAVPVSVPADLVPPLRPPLRSPSFSARAFSSSI